VAVKYGEKISTSHHTNFAVIFGLYDFHPAFCSFYAPPHYNNMQCLCGKCSVEKIVMLFLTHIEVCEDQACSGTVYGRKNPFTPQKYAEACYNEMVAFSVDFFRTYFNGDSAKVTTKTLTTHVEGNKMGIASNHGDPWHWLGKYGYSGDTLRKAVKDRLKKDEEKPTPPASKKLYRVQVGAYSIKANADAALSKARAAGFKDASIKYE